MQELGWSPIRGGSCGWLKSLAFKFIAVSKAIRQRAIEFGIPPEKLLVRYIGIDSSRFSPGPIPVARLLPGVPGSAPEKYAFIESFDETAPDLSTLELAEVGLQVHLPESAFPAEICSPHFPFERGRSHGGK